MSDPNRSKTLPNLFIEFSEAFWVALEFIDGILVPSIVRQNDRSRIQRNLLDLWGIIATGDILRYSGNLSLIFQYRIIFVNPSSNRYHSCT